MNSLSANNIDFFEFLGNYPIKYQEISKDIKIIREVQRADNLIDSKKSYTEDRITITGPSKNAFKMFREFFSVLYDIKFKYLGYGAQIIDNSCGQPYITTIYLGVLEDDKDIRIELNNCGVTIGVGKSSSIAFDQRHFIGNYENNSFDILTLVHDLKWKLPKNFENKIIKCS